MSETTGMHRTDGRRTDEFGSDEFGSDEFGTGEFGTEGYGTDQEGTEQRRDADRRPGEPGAEGFVTEGLTTEQLAGAGSVAPARMDDADSDTLLPRDVPSEPLPSDALQQNASGAVPDVGATPVPASTAVSTSSATPASTSASNGDGAQLLDPDQREAMTGRWRDIQAGFVDQPRQAVNDADGLVAGLMQQLAQMFAQERSQLEAQWSRGDEVSTEELRVSLQRYRAFFERLLSV